VSKRASEREGTRRKNPRGDEILHTRNPYSKPRVGSSFHPYDERPRPSSGQSGGPSSPFGSLTLRPAEDPVMNQMWALGSCDWLGRFGDGVQCPQQPTRAWYCAVHAQERTSIYGVHAPCYGRALDHTSTHLYCFANLTQVGSQPHSECMSFAIPEVSLSTRDQILSQRQISWSSGSLVSASTGNFVTPTQVWAAYFPKSDFHSHIG